jgi:hypothetical protein
LPALIVSAEEIKAWVAILVDKWVASMLDWNIDNIVFTVAILVDKWVARNLLKSAP